MIQKCLSLLWPEVCPFCEMLSKKGICDQCSKDLKELEVKEPKCFKCGKTILNEEDSFCTDCTKQGRYFECGTALWNHQGVVSESIYRFKYHNQRRYGMLIGRRIAESLRDEVDKWGPQVIIPVPLCKRRRRERGFNQSLILALEIGEILNIPVREYVKRVKETLPQKNLDKQSRKANLREAFIIDEMPRLKRVLIVDDIFTTGSTIDEMAKILKKAGVLQVFFLTISIGQEI